MSFTSHRALFTCMSPAPINSSLPYSCTSLCASYRNCTGRFTKSELQISILLSFCHLRVTENLFCCFFFPSKYRTSARNPQQNSFCFKFSTIPVLPFMWLKEQVFCGLMSLVKCEHKKQHFYWQPAEDIFSLCGQIPHHPQETYCE